MSVPSADQWAKWLAVDGLVNEANVNGSPAEDVRFATCTAPTNIAVIKYWGKRNEELILPLNSSISVTLNQKDLCTTTTVIASSHFAENLLWLNGKCSPLDSDRALNCLTAIGARIPSGNGFGNLRLHIYSDNNFPTAAGLASSASGFACLVYTICQLFSVPEKYPGEISAIARQGSGSACRSLYGGFVEWFKGTTDDGLDSIAIPVAPAAHWPEIEVLICVVSDVKKSVSSTSGMKTSCVTSPFLNFRADKIVDGRIADMKTAILGRDFAKFAELTMRDSNQFHSTCLDTYPPIFYMNDVSKAIVNLIHFFNSKDGVVKAAYTFDAGPNAVIFLPRQYVQELLSVLLLCYQPEVESDHKFVRSSEAELLTVAPLAAPAADAYAPFRNPGAVKHIIHTTSGPGPQRLH